MKRFVGKRALLPLTMREALRRIWQAAGYRGFMVLFGGLCAAGYVLFALTPVTYQSLLVASLLLETSFLFVSN